MKSLKGLSGDTINRKRTTSACCHPLLLSVRPNFSSEYHRRSMNVLETALNQVGAYKSWKIFDPGEEYPIDLRYAAMPVLTKKNIRKHFPRGLMPVDRDIEDGLASGEVEFVNTSGTVDDSVTNIWNQKWWDASERASWRLNSHAEKIATGNHPEAILASPLNVGFVSDHVDLPMEKRRLARFLYLNEKTDPRCWTSEQMDRMIRELGVYRTAVLEANPSLLARLCRYVIAKKKAVFQPRLIVFTYEYPTSFHYRQIQRVLRVPTASSYGSTEAGYVFMQCEQGKFHQNCEFCRVDFQPLKTKHGGPSLGRILITTFNNPWYHLVRFNIGDLVRLDEEGRCSCGRGSGLILSAIEGRVKDVTLTCDGRLVTLRELDNALSVLEGVDEYQLRQLSPYAYRLHLVTQRTDRRSLREEATDILSKLYGQEARISVIYETAIAPEPSGKYRVSAAMFPLKIEGFLRERHTCIEGEVK